MDRMPDVYLVEFLETQCLASVFDGVLTDPSWSVCFSDCFSSGSGIAESWAYSG